MNHSARKLRLLSKVRRLYYKHSRNYNALHVENALQYINLRDKDVLIIGCNKGKDCPIFIKRGANSVHGVDVIDDIGSEYKHKRVAYFKQSVEDMDLPNERYDLVYCFATMEHVKRIDLAFPEMARVARTGGIVYSVAAPLWHSRYGHHKKNLFEHFPWIHLRMDRDEIVELAEQEGITANPNIVYHIDYMLNPLYFNKVPSSEYLKVCNSLENIEIIVNRLDSEPENVLPPELAVELANKGFGPEDLLPSTHTFIGRKL